MGSIQRVGDLDIAQDLEFEHRSWKVQRFGWGLMTLIVLGAFLGLFGNGLLNNAKAGKEGDRLWLEYDRFGRLQKAFDLKIHLGANTGDGGQLRVWLSRNYLDNIEIRQITPEPEIVEAGPDGLIFVFRQSQPNQPTEVTFIVEPERPGSLVGKVKLTEGELINFSHFVYP